MKRILKKEEFYKLLNGLLKDYEVIGPNQIPNRGIFYQVLNDAKDLYLGEGFTTEPIKKFFLSPSEWIFKEHFKEGSNFLEDIPIPHNKRIIIGARPCETRGLTLLDKVFNSDYKDNFYIHNHNRTIIIGLACDRPDESCFCTSMGGSPVESRGMDALIFTDKNEFVIEIVTDRGGEIFHSLGGELAKEKEKSLEASKEERKNLLKKKIKVPETLDKFFNSNYWEKVSQACLSCGICTYLCPTCHCFDLIDEERKRLRCYDGCAFSDFTQQASGENPRPTKSQRYRQRVFHKFDYFKKNFGENLCVGCGRCIRHCPVKIDIAEIVANVSIS